MDQLPILFEGLLMNLLESYSLARVWHLQTRSHAEHMCFQDYYESIEDSFDSLAEQYQGVMGGEYRIQYLKSLDLAGYEEVDIKLYFHSLLEDVEEVSVYVRQYPILSHLVNLLDEAKSTISKTCYLLSLS